MIDTLKPYPEYKDSGVEWLGQVPVHWRVLPGRACFREKKVLNIGLRENTVLSLSYGKIVVKPLKKLYGLVPASFETYQVVDPNDIICRSTDLQNDWNSLRFGISRYRGIITSAYMNLNCTTTIRSVFGYLLLHTYDLIKVFYGLGSGLRQNLDWRDFKYLQCVLPPLPEQTAIVRFLDWAERRIRRVIRARQKRIKLLQEYKQALIHQAVTGQIDVRTNQPYSAYKDAGVEWLGQVPAHWEVVPIKRAFRLIEYGISESASESGTVRLLTMGNIRDGQVIVPDSGGVESVDPKLLLEPGDLLFNRTNSAELVAKVGIFTGSDSAVTFASYLVRMRPNPGQEPYFLNLLLNDLSILSLARREAIPSLHQSNLNPTRYGRLAVALPPKGEQLAIVATAKAQSEKIDAAIAADRRQIELLQELRTRLIADVITGKLDVREVAAMLPDAPDANDAEVLDDEPVAVDKANGDFALETGEVEV